MPKALISRPPKHTGTLDALIKRRNGKPFKRLYTPCQQNHAFQKPCPLLRLNDDLLVYIIKMLLPPPESRLDPCILYKDRETLGPLLRTCHRIGDLIYSTPSFWNYVSARMTSVDIRRRIELSQSMPLTIKFVTPILVSEEFHAYFFDSIRGAIPRWQRILILDLRDWNHCFSSHPCLVSLKELTIDKINTFYEEFWKCSFPSLEILRFSATGTFPSATAFPSLRRCEFVADSIRTDQLRTILSSIPTVESLTIRLCLSNDDDDDDDDELPSDKGSTKAKISLPHLEKLAINDYSGERFTFLQMCSLPKVRTLTFSDSLEGRRSTRIDDMVSERDTFPVEFLELVDTCTISGHLDSVLKLFPSVRELRLNMEKRPSIEKPDWSGINKRRCPNLESLVVKHSFSDPTTLREVLDGLDWEGMRVEYSDWEVLTI